VKLLVSSSSKQCQIQDAISQFSIHFLHKFHNQTNTERERERESVPETTSESLKVRQPFALIESAREKKRRALLNAHSLTLSLAWRVQ
jgi:ubiquitin C-terminal hydrolase